MDTTPILEVINDIPVVPRHHYSIIEITWILSFSVFSGILLYLLHMFTPSYGFNAPIDFLFVGIYGFLMFILSMAFWLVQEYIQALKKDKLPRVIDEENIQTDRSEGDICLQVKYDFGVYSWYIIYGFITGIIMDSVHQNIEQSWLSRWQDYINIFLFSFTACFFFLVFWVIYGILYRKNPRISCIKKVVKKESKENSHATTNANTDIPTNTNNINTTSNV